MLSAYIKSIESFGRFSKSAVIVAISTVMPAPPIKAYVYPGYGIVSVGKVAVEVTLQLYLFDFYTRILGLSPLLAGLAFAVAILWDAISDVIVSFGLIAIRRKGVSYSALMWGGACLLACTTVFLFSPAIGSTQMQFFAFVGSVCVGKYGDDSVGLAPEQPERGTDCECERT